MALGVYLHIPFCRHRCDYCAFATWTDRHHLQERYLEACRRQVEAETEAGIPPVTSVFVGGGTPSLVDPDRLLSVLDAIPTTPDAEITIETNPDDLDGDRAAVYAAGGVNRISLGVQSMVPHVLRALGRTHDPDNVHRAVRALHDADIAFNVDLIYGAAGETDADWERTLDEAIALRPAHVSAYALTIEAGTPLATQPARHPDDDVQADRYEHATDRLERAGFDWYEISNWARPGHECRHNQLYWSSGDYLAIGCAAHGHRDGRRFWNHRTPERYIRSIEAGTTVESGSEELDPETRRAEALQLAIRTRDGIPADAAPDGFVERFEGFVEHRGDRIVLTRAGRFLADDLALRLI